MKPKIGFSLKQQLNILLMKPTTSIAIKTTPLRGSSIRLLQCVLVSVGLLLVSTCAEAQLARTRITSVRVENMNVVVTARVPAGPHSATLESRAGFGSDSWQTRATMPLSGVASNVTFHLPRSHQMEFLRVRLDGVTNPPPRMVVFGDSLTDTGNHFDMFGTPAPPNYQGRYSDGPVWIEYLAARLGLNPNEWVNYAVGSATSGREDAYDRIERPGMLDELDLYLAESASLGSPETNALFVLWIGANDFARWQQTGAYTNHSPDVLIGTLLQNIRTVIETLADRGATQFFVVNLPDLGKIPLVNSYPNPLAAEIASLGTFGFNLNLAWMLGEMETQRSNTIDIVHFDMFSLFEAARTNPTAFGFTNVVAECWAGATNSPCTASTNYLFWDDRHPTTAAHRWLGERALAALATDPPLPSGCPVAPTNAPRVRIATRHGQFTTAPTIEITGTMDGAMPAGATLHVNGTPTEVATDGSFALMVSLSVSNLANPITAEVRAGGRVLARDRIVVFEGPSIGHGDIASNAVVASLNAHGVKAIEDEIIHKLFEDGTLNFWDNLDNPLKTGFIPDALPGLCDASYIATATSLNYSCATANAELHQGFIRLRFRVHDIALGYHIYVWSPDCPDPGFDCDALMYVSSFGVYMDFVVKPAASGRPGEVDVRAVSGLEKEPYYLQNTVFDCDPDLFDVVKQRVQEEANEKVRQKFQNTVDRFISSADRNKIAEALERIIAKVSISGPLGDALGVTLRGDIQAISHREGQLDVRFTAGFFGSNTLTAETYAPPAGIVDHTGLDPVAGQTYDFAASVSLKTLNQLLLAESGRIPQRWEITQFDLGTGNLPVTAGLLSLFFPALRAEPPATPYKLAVRPTLPPMIVNGSSVACSGVEVAMDQVRLDIVRMDGGHETVVLAVALDLRACVAFGYDRARSSLTIRLPLSSEILHNTAIVENRICASEAVVSRILATALNTFITEFGGITWYFPIPRLAGLEITPTRIVPQQGYVSVFVDVAPEIGRPDLIVAELDAPASIDPNFSFAVRARVKNIGHAPAFGGTWIGGSLSPDDIYQNGNDGGVGQQFFNFTGGSLGVGESEWHTLSNLGPAPWALRGNQTLFVSVDVPGNLGGSGLFCESSELNNHASKLISVGSPDLVVADIETLSPVVPFQLIQCRVLLRNQGSGPVFLPIQIGFGLSQDCVPINGNDVPLGILPITFPSPLDAGESRWYTFTTLPIGGAVPGSKYLIAAVDLGLVIPEENEFNNVHCEPVQVLGSDLAVHSMKMLKKVIQNHSTRVEIVITNRGEASVSIPFAVGLWLSFDRIPSVSDDVPLGLRPVNDTFQPHQSRTYVFDTDGIGNSIATSQYLLATTDALFVVPESNENNNVGAQLVTVEVPWWDLRFSIVNADSSARQCRTADWTVRVTNVGNVDAPGVCFITGIAPYCGPRDWRLTLPFRSLATGALSPGQTRDILINNYPIPCFTTLGTLNIKAEVNSGGPHCLDHSTQNLSFCFSRLLGFVVACSLLCV